MRYWKWGELRTKIINEHDLQEEPDILAEGELLGYVNDAIDMVEAHFIKLQDYFRAVTEPPIEIIPGQKDYQLPDDIWAQKIRLLTYKDDWEIKDLKDIKKTIGFKAESGEPTNFLIYNNKGAKPFIRLYPTPNLAADMTMHYTREASRITENGGDDQEIDIPEAMNFLKAYVDFRIYKKERDPIFTPTKEEIQYFEKLLLDSLAVRVDDDNNEIQPDISLYQEHM